MVLDVNTTAVGTVLMRKAVIRGQEIAPMAVNLDILEVPVLQVISL